VEPIGPYEVVREVGRGGMGVVFEGRAPGGDRVAIKQLLATDRDAQERFNRERRLLGSFTIGEGFVPLLDAGTSARGPYLVMPFIEGGTLSGRLRGGPLSVKDALALGRRLASALGKAHAKNVVHRDMKPANVLFQGSVPLVSDLGIAKHFRRDPLAGTASASLSVTGEFMGSPGYAAPEQIDDPKSVGPAADVFAVGSILYECLAGRPAFGGGDRFAAIARTATTQVEPLSKHCEGVPRWLEDVVIRALEKDPLARYPDGNALFVALRGPRGRTALPLALAALALGGAVLGAFFGWPAPPAPLAPVEKHAPPPPPAPPVVKPREKFVVDLPNGTFLLRASVDPAIDRVFAACVYSRLDTLVLDMNGRLVGKIPLSGTVVDPVTHRIFSSTGTFTQETVIQSGQTLEEIFPHLTTIGARKWCGGFFDVDPGAGVVYGGLECGPPDGLEVLDVDGRRIALVEMPLGFGSVDTILVDPGSHQVYVSQTKKVSGNVPARLCKVSAPPELKVSEPIEDLEAVALDRFNDRVVCRSRGLLAFLSTTRNEPPEVETKVAFGFGYAVADPTRSRLYLASDATKAVVTVLDRSLEVVGTIDFGRDMTPTALCVTPDAKTLYLFLIDNEKRAVGIARLD
jgi:hypothetical protein